MISKEDLNSWNEFADKNFKKSNPNNCKLSENSKKFLKKVKQNIKNNKILNNNEFNNNLSNLDTFVLEKDKTLGINTNSDRKLTLGKYDIDSKIDLHGLTLSEAYEKVRLFFNNAVIRKYKCILVITGKGKHSTNTTIKESIRDWLKQPYFANNIIKYTDASQKDGGSGAIYILLRNK